MKKKLLHFMFMLSCLPIAVRAQVSLMETGTTNDYTGNTPHYICSGNSNDNPRVTLTATVSPSIGANTRIDLAIRAWDYNGTFLGEVDLDKADIFTSASLSTVSWDIEIANNEIITNRDNNGHSFFNRQDAIYEFKGTYADAGNAVHDFFTQTFRLREGSDPWIKITAAGASISSWGGSNNCTILKGCVNNDPRLRLVPSQCGTDGFRVLAIEIDRTTGNWVGTQINKLLSSTEITALMSTGGLPINGLTDGTTTLTLLPGKLYSIALVYVGQTAWKISSCNMFYKDGTWDLVLHDNTDDNGYEPYHSDNVFNSADLWNRLSTSGAGTAHEEPTFVTMSGNTNKMMVKVTNTGCSPSPAGIPLRMFWTRARTNELWAQHWLYDITTPNNNYTTNSAFPNVNLPMGSEITISNPSMSAPYNTTSIPFLLPAISGGTSYTIPYANAVDWFPPNPQWYDKNSGSMTNGHPVICLLARINEASSTNDPILWEPASTNVKILPYVKNNNNIATRNTYVVVKPGFLIAPTGTNWNYGIGTVAVQNSNISSRTIRLCVDILPDGVTTGTFNNWGSMEMVATTGLYNAWLSGGSQVTNVVAAGGTAFTVTDGSHACLENITLAPGTDEQIGVRFNYNAATLPTTALQYNYQLSESTGSGETLTYGSNTIFIADVPVENPVPPMSKTGSTGVAGIIVSEGLQLYPNPAETYLTISWNDEKFAAKKVEVYDIAAKLVMSYDVNDVINKTHVDITKLSAGTYVIKIISTDGLSKQSKFIKN